MGLSPKDRKTLWGRSRHLCAFPQCRRQLTADQVDAKTGETFRTIVGEEAHILAVTRGASYDAKYPANELETYENRILLCSIHHTFIDSEKGRAYDPVTLTAMKRRHERQEERRERISEPTVRAYVADQYEADDKVLFGQVKFKGIALTPCSSTSPSLRHGATQKLLPASLRSRKMHRVTQ